MEFKHTLGRWQMEYGTLWFPQGLSAEFRQVVPFGPFDLEINGEIIAEHLEADFMNLSISIGREKMQVLFSGSEVVLVSSDLEESRLILRTLTVESNTDTPTPKSSPTSKTRAEPVSKKTLRSKKFKPRPVSTTDLVFVDTETTGFSPEFDEVIEIAAIRVNGDLEEIGRFQSFLIPHGSVRAVHIHGLTREFLIENGRPQEGVYRELVEFIGDHPIAGHNVCYDQRMLQANGMKNNVNLRLRIAYDTLPHARSVLRLPSYKLGHLSAALNLGDGALNCHNALDDVLATIELAKHLNGVVQE